MALLVTKTLRLKQNVWESDELASDNVGLFNKIKTENKTFGLLLLK